ncbi:MAG: molybdopterin-dependent oxidoreductase, partial [Notoacmeibacter sp.]|nr:molybdopterin-dependent oxidoreductase [Notoacmeibacter sp.]
MGHHDQTDMTAATIQGGVAKSQRHDSGHKHVTGQAVYIDDIPEPAGCLHAAVGLSTVAHGKVLAIHTGEALRVAGVVDIFTGADMPGSNDISPTGRNDEPVLASEHVQFYGQPVFAVVAKTRAIARRAARLVKVDYQELPSILTYGDVGEQPKLVCDPLTLKRGDAAAALDSAPRRLSGQILVGGQDHFYLEGHIALAIPGEDGDMFVHSSTQHPSEVQHMVAHVLGVPNH